MRTTKNISINEVTFGFTVNNNFATVASYDNINAAIVEAFKIAKTENKGITVNTDFIKIKRTAKQVAKKDACTNWIEL